MHMIEFGLEGKKKKSFPHLHSPAAWETSLEVKVERPGSSEVKKSHPEGIFFYHQLCFFLVTKTYLRIFPIAM